MNKITIILKESGSVADLKKNFKIYQHSSQNVLINILVPKEIVEGKLHAQYFNEKGGIASESGIYTALKIGLSYTQDDGKLGKTESYYVRYLKDIKNSDGEYMVYERVMPSVFTRVAGVGLSAPYMVINLVNILNNATVDLEEKVNKPVTLSLITSQKCVLEIEPSTELDIEQPVEPDEMALLEGIVNDVLQKVDNKADIANTVLKLNVLEEMPNYAKYEKDGFKTLGVHFFNEKFTVPIEEDATAEKQGAVYVAGFRPHESEQYWIYQDEFFSFPGGLVTRTLTLNATQSAIGQYTVMNVGNWEIVNQQYINEISNRINTNTNDLSESLRKKAEELDGKIDSEVNRLDTKIDDGDSNLSSRITDEVKTLNDTIESQESRLDQKINNESSKLDAKIDKQTQHFTEVTDKNIQDIQKIQDFINSGSTDLGEYPSAKALPSDEQLNQYVKSVVEREPKEGDRLTFVLSKPNETDTIYLIKYSEATSSWTKTALPMLEKASNDNHGIIIGTDNETYKTEVQQGFRKAIVDIKGGEITDITHLNEAEGLESIFDHLNRNSNDIDSNTISINENKENLAAEVQRAGLAEKTNKEAIEAEVSRATQEETNLNNLITSEISRVETAAAEDLQTEITRVENEASEALNDEITRATGEEKRINDYFKGEIERVESGADSALQEEIKRATGAEQGLQSSLGSEIERAKAAEVDNATNIENEIDRASKAEQNLEETKLNKSQINENYIKNLTFSLNGDTNVVSVAFKNPVSGEESSIEMTVIGAASEVLSGLMTAEMVKAFNQALHDIETVKYIGRQIKTFNTYAEAELFDWSTIEEIHINDYFIVQEDESRESPAEQGKTTRYNCIDDNKPITIDSFRFHSIVNTVQIQLATETLLGGVLSTNAKGYVYVESNGAMKLVGYDEILTSINNLISDLTSETQRAKSAEEANASAIAGEMARAQAAESANSDAISAEVLRAQAAEKGLEDNKADRDELPQNLSDLNDDLGIITEDTQKTKTSQLENDGDGTQIQGKADKFALVSQLPTKLSQMAEDNAHRLTTDEEKNSWNNKLDLEDLADINKKLESITTEQLTQNSQIDQNKTDIVDINSEIESIKTEQLTQNTEIGKVDSKISSAISAVVNKAPAAFDTLKEIADWIEEDKTGTAALTQRVTDIETKNASQDEAISNAQSTADDASNAAKTAQSTANGKYTKPRGGIPADDLAGSIPISKITDLTTNLEWLNLSSNSTIDPLTRKRIRDHIDAGTSNFDGQYSSLTGTPTLGSLASKSTITSADITDGTITNADISNSAAIAQSKIANLTNDLSSRFLSSNIKYGKTSTSGTSVNVNHGLGKTPSSVLCFFENPNDKGRNYFLTGVTSTTFTVSFYSSNNASASSTSGTMHWVVFA